MVPDGKIPSFDWWAIASLDLGVAIRPYFALSARASVATLDDKPLTKLVNYCVARLKPMYGIGFHRNHSQGPWFYAVGMNYASPIQQASIDYEEALTISRWGDLGVVKEVYKEGVLRDVYPHNYLSRPQLARRIGEETLEVWISSNPSRGTLTNLDERIVLWKVAGREINRIREQLCSAGFIFDWRSYLGE
jgi:hypothetical protein